MVDTEPDTPAPTIESRLYHDLREAITSLRIPPGAPISEGDVCRRFGGSRTPARAALSRLEREGLLCPSQFGTKLRLIVAPLTASDMKQLFLMVGALNGVAARLAAQLDEGARRRLVEQMRAINDGLRQFGQRDAADVRQAEDLDGRFHRAYEAVAGAPQLVVELDWLGARRTRYTRVYTEALLQAHNLRESVAEHDAIIEALASGDPDAAERRAADNYRQALRRFELALHARGERGGWF
ncbi:MAG TPA: GntR family transcriptional regulator [Vicinamibacterales bacterium]